MTPAPDGYAGKTVTLPIEMMERLVDLAASAPGNANIPALMMFADVRLLIEAAKAKP